MSTKFQKIGLLLAIFGIGMIGYKCGLTLACPIYKITGLYCPGCGITRCLLSLLKLDFYQAFRYNPLVFILLPFLGSYVIYKLYIWIFEKKDHVTKHLVKAPLYILIAVLIVYGILRNTSMFVYLRPTVIT